jgi:hypothetical protein
MGPAMQTFKSIKFSFEAVQAKLFTCKSFSNLVAQEKQLEGGHEFF